MRSYFNSKYLFQRNSAQSPCTFFHYISNGKPFCVACLEKLAADERHHQAANSKNKKNVKV